MTIIRFSSFSMIQGKMCWIINALLIVLMLSINFDTVNAYICWDIFDPAFVACAPFAPLVRFSDCSNSRTTSFNGGYGAWRDCCQSISCSRACGAQCESDGNCPGGSCSGSCTCQCPPPLEWRDGRCREPEPICECSGGWQPAPGTGGCGRCGTVQRLCDGCHWTNDYRCVNEGPCSPGQAEYTGGSCGPGSCGSTRRDCQGNCQWGGWYCCCGIPNAGQPCNCGACGCGGTIQCNGACSGPNPTPSNYGQSCGSCGGTIQCNGACSIPTPGNYGQSCNCNPCGCGGTIQCNGACSGSPPSCDCPAPPPNYNQPCGSCGGRIRCDGTCSIPTPPNYNQPCGSCGGRIRCDGSCSIPTPGNYGQPCGSCGGTIQCNGACSGSPPPCDCPSPPPNYNQPCGSCGGRIRCDGSCSIPTPGNYGQPCGNGGTIRCDGSCSVPCTPTEISCSDGRDNDCDGLVDCADPDCDGSIAGTVRNQNNNLIQLADVSAKKGLTTVKTSTTNQLGKYSMGISCGIYNVVASHPEYASQVKNNILVAGRQEIVLNFSLVLGTSCKPDCTFVADNIIHAACDGKNGCSFYDNIAKASCDLSQPGWVRDYNASHYVVCASGSPQQKVEIQASVSCSGGTLVKVTRIVVYNGKPVKLVVATCG